VHETNSLNTDEKVIKRRSIQSARPQGRQPGNFSIDKNRQLWGKFSPKIFPNDLLPALPTPQLSRKGLSPNNCFSAGHIVTPAKAGVQEISESLDSGPRFSTGQA
jgi:hypothetical protein